MCESKFEDMFENKNLRIEFIDRPLRKGEKYHHRCRDCGQELHPDLAYSHRCNPLGTKRSHEIPFDKYEMNMGNCYDKRHNKGHNQKNFRTTVEK